MRRILIAQLFLGLAMPLNAAIDPEIHKSCLEAADYKGCVSAHQSQTKFEKDLNHEEANTPTKEKLPKKLSDYGIKDYASAVTWCKNNLAEIDFEIFKPKNPVMLKSNSNWYYCRKNFVDLLKSRDGSFCEDCGLIPNKLLDNVIQDYISELKEEKSINKDVKYLNEPNVINKSNEKIASVCPEGRKNYTYSYKDSPSLIGLLRKRKVQTIEFECLTSFEFFQAKQIIELQKKLRRFEVNQATKDLQKLINNPYSY